PREQRPALLELAQDVAPERGVLLKKLTPPAIPLVGLRPALLPDQRPDQRQRLDRVDERVELEQLAFLPEQPVELGPVEGPEPAPENEVLRRRNGGDRIELEEAEPPHGVEDAARRAVQQLRPDGDPPRRIDVDGASHPANRKAAPSRTGSVATRM